MKEQNLVLLMAKGLRWHNPPVIRTRWEWIGTRGCTYRLIKQGRQESLWNNLLFLDFFFHNFDTGLWWGCKQIETNFANFRVVQQFNLSSIFASLFSVLSSLKSRATVDPTTPHKSTLVVGVFYKKVNGRDIYD